MKKKKKKKKKRVELKKYLSLIKKMEENQAKIFINKLDALDNTMSSENDYIRIFHDIIKDENIYHFNEFISYFDTNLSSSYKNLYSIFRYGTYNDYINLVSHNSNIIQLDDIEIKKLRQLTILSIFNHMKENNPYDSIYQYNIFYEKLDIVDKCILEDLFIDMIQKEIIKAKLDNENEKITVNFFISRDVHDIKHIKNKFIQWSNNIKQLINELNK